VGLIYKNNDNPAIYCEKSQIGFKNTIYVYDNLIFNLKQNFSNK
jgi:hypothetical protein